MPNSRPVEWIDAGCIAYSSGLRHVLERLHDAGVIRFQDQHLFLALGCIISPDHRDDFLKLINESSLELEEVAMEEDQASPRQKALLHDPMADRHLEEIYRHIPSPPPQHAPQPEEVMTKMFPYQLRTLHRMLEREQNPTPVQSGHMIPLNADHEYDLKLNPFTLEITKCSPSHSVNDSKGGILSEEMGVGKTLECLSLILSTRGSLPDADDDDMASSVTTILALDWPHRDGHGLDPLPADALSLAQIPYYAQRDVQQSNSSQIRAPLSPNITATSLPTLKHLCAHVMRLSGQRIAADQYHDEEKQVRVRAMEAMLKSATPFFHLWPPIRGHRTPRVEVQRTPIKIYLSTATLVVVPGTLLAQWQREIVKHVKPGSLRVLYLPNAQSQIPLALELANDYDIILLSHARLGKEENEGALEWKWPNVPRRCRCPYIGASRVVDCSCPNTVDYQLSTSMSPLLQCRFKRLCVDEGHVAAGDSNMVRMATKIRSECRWVISGTPTESLVGSDLYRRQSTNSEGISSVEKRDLEKIRSLLADFLHVPHLQDCHHHYELPFKRGALYASTRLWSLLSRVMVRNQPQDIEGSSPLPPLHDEIIRLDFNRLERETFNVLQSLILLNAVWSQREDDDYFFHHSNRKYLASIIENLSLSCFHFAGPNLKEQAREAVNHAKKQLEKKDKWKLRDIEEAMKAILHLEKALNDNEWVNQSSDVVYRTAQVPVDIAKSWARYGIRGQSELSAEEITAMQRAMRGIVNRQTVGLLEDGDLAREEELITEGEKDRRAFHQREAKAAICNEKRAAKTPECTTALAMPSSPKSPYKVSSRSGATSSNKAAKISVYDFVRKEYENRHQHQLATESSLYTAHLTSTSSTKLAKLLEVIAAIPQDEKVIIFSNLDNALYEVSTALDVASLPHFIYALGSSQERRNEIIDAYRSEQTFVRILLMKSNIGGRGLDLSCANHSIFLEPILDKSLRVQAIKRTWRTGQTRPVYTKTLIIKDTFEEDILRISETANTSKLSEDPNMRAVVSNPVFILQGSNEIYQKLAHPIALFTSGWSLAVDTSRNDVIPLPTPPVTPDKTYLISDGAASVPSLAETIAKQQVRHGLDEHANEPHRKKQKASFA